MSKANNKKSFLMWLSEQAYRTDEIGSFAKEMIKAENVPMNSRLLEWYKFISENRLTTIKVLTKVWEEYIAEVRDGGNERI